MSLASSPKPTRPVRPPPGCPPMVQPLKLTPPCTTTSPDRPPTHLQAPLYMDVLPNGPKTPGKFPPLVPKRPLLSRQAQIPETEFMEKLDAVEKWNLGRDEESSSISKAKFCQEKDFIFPVRPPPPPPVAPPRPVARPRPAARLRPAALQHRRPFLSQSTPEDSCDHIYEFIPDVLPETPSQEEDVWGLGDSPVVPNKCFSPAHPLRSWSEQSSVDNVNTKELDVLLEWWRSVEDWEKLIINYQGNEKRLLTVLTQRVKTGMRLYELLVFQRGNLLLKHITELHCTADSLEKVSKKARIVGLTGGTTGAVGAAAVVAGIALAPLTFGASMVVAGLGAGVAAAGGVTGASAVITNKVKNSQCRNKVEKILDNYQLQMEDIVECLKFVDTGMKRLRNRGRSEVKNMDACTMKLIRVAQDKDDFGCAAAVSEYSCVLQGFAARLDSYFTVEDRMKLKTGSESQFAESVREVADKLKEGMSEVIRIKNLFRSIADSIYS